MSAFTSRYTALLPELSEEQYRELRDDIAERGCLVPIELDEDGQILDGSHRLRACQELGLRPPTITRPGLSEPEKRAHALALNLQRRHLDQAQKRNLIAELVKAAPEKSDRQHAEAAGVSPTTVGTVRRDLEISGDVSNLDTRVDTAGREQPASKPAPKPAPVIDISGAITKRQAEQRVHYSSETDEWATPQDLFDVLGREFSFELDVCALPSSAKCERFFTPEDDGLAQEWRGTCWMNPPYGREIGVWMTKAFASARAGATVVCLVPARTDTRWWWDTARWGEVRFLRGRLRFGDAKAGAPFPSAVVVFRPGMRQRVVWWEPDVEVEDVAA